MKQHYEDKLMQLQDRIKATQDERDKVLASFSGQQNQPTDKVSTPENISVKHSRHFLPFVVISSIRQN